VLNRLLYVAGPNYSLLGEGTWVGCADDGSGKHINRCLD